MPDKNDVRNDQYGALSTCDCQEDTEDQLIKNIVTQKVTTIPAELYASGRQVSILQSLFPILT